MASETYIGDGVYASFDGYSITLRAPREYGDHFVVLEPDMIQTLVEYTESALREHLKYRTALTQSEAK